MSWLQYWTDYTTCGLNKDENPRQVRTFEFVNIFSLLAIVSFFGFGLVHLFIGEYLSGWFEITIGALVVVNLIITRLFCNLTQSTNISLLLLLITFVFLIITGGIHATGVLWIHTFPIVAFYFKGKRRGLLWISFMIGLIFMFYFLQIYGRITLPFTPFMIRQTGFSVSVVAFLIYFYEQITQTNETLAHEKTKELAALNKALSNDIAKQGHIQLEVEEKNKQLEDTKLATLNVLEDLEESRSRTEEEKVRAEALIASMGDGVIATDNKGLIIVVNDASLDMLGYKRQELIGKELTSVIAMQTEKGEPVEVNDRLVSKALKTKTKVAGTRFYLRKDGSSVPVSITVTPLMMKNHPKGTISVFRDISKEMEIDRAKSEFVSLASHQLRTPLSSVRWYSEMLLSGDAGKVSSNQKQYLTEIYQSNQRMTDLVNALLNVSRLDLGTFIIDPEPTDLAAIADSVLKELVPQIKTKKIKVSASYDAKLPKINADAKLMRIIIQNLLSNSVKYTPNNGSVAIAIEKDTKNITITVKDSGYGIPKKQQEKIFSKLFRADNVKAKDTEGTGLGLYIVKSIIDHSGGNVSFVSAENKGTTFHVSFPLSGMKKKEGTRELSLEKVKSD